MQERDDGFGPCNTADSHTWRLPTDKPIVYAEIPVIHTHIHTYMHMSKS